MDVNSPTNTDDKSETSFSRNVVVATVLGLSLQPDLVTLLCSVFFDILLSTFKDGLPFLVVLGTLLQIIEFKKNNR